MILIWIAVFLMGIPLAALGIKKGVFAMAAAAFNFLISVYIAVLSLPALLQNNSVLQGSPYYAAFCMLFLTAACFVLLHGLCYVLFLRGADCVFPVVFEKAAGGLLGFILGYFLAALLCLAVCMMPVSRHELFRRFISLEKIKAFSASAAVKCCHFMAGWSLQYLCDKPEKTVEYLISLGDPKESAAPSSTQPPIAPTAPNPEKPAPSPGRLDENRL